MPIYPMSWKSWIRPNELADELHEMTRHGGNIYQNVQVLVRYTQM